MSEHSSSEHGADNARAERATSLPVPTFAVAEITGGIETLTVTDTKSEQMDRLVRIIESQREALLTLVSRDAKASQGAGETAKSKKYAHIKYVFFGPVMNDLGRVGISHSGATNPAYLNGVSTYDFLTLLLNENVTTQFRSAGVTTEYKLLLSTLRTSLLTSSAMGVQLAGEQDMALCNIFESIF
jgi:hypothetical protein